MLLGELCDLKHIVSALKQCDLKHIVSVLRQLRFMLPFQGDNSYIFPYPGRCPGLGYIRLSAFNVFYIQPLNSSKFSHKKEY